MGFIRENVFFVLNIVILEDRVLIFDGGGIKIGGVFSFFVL